MFTKIPVGPKRIDGRLECGHVSDGHEQALSSVRDQILRPRVRRRHHRETAGQCLRQDEGQALLDGREDQDGGLGVVPTEAVPRDLTQIGEGALVPPEQRLGLGLDTSRQPQLGHSRTGPLSSSLEQVADALSQTDAPDEQNPERAVLARYRVKHPHVHPERDAVDSSCRDTSFQEGALDKA